MQTNRLQARLNGIQCRGKRLFEEEQVIIEETWNTYLRMLFNHAIDQVTERISAALASCCWLLFPFPGLQRLWTMFFLGCLSRISRCHFAPTFSG